MIKLRFFIVAVLVSALHDKIANAFCVRKISHCQNPRCGDMALEGTFWWDSLPGAPRYSSKQKQDLAKDKKMLEKVLKDAKSTLDEANEALAAANSALETTAPSISGSNWSEMNVASLKAALKERSLKVTGKKNDLIARLEAFEVEDAAAVVDKTVGGEEETAETLLDAAETENVLEEAATAESVLDDEETAETVLEEPATAEKELAEVKPADSVNMETGTAASTAASSSGNSQYEGMTVAELKTELREKGLKVGGKKADLIQRLQSNNENSSSLAAEPAESTEADEPEKPHEATEVDINENSSAAESAGSMEDSWSLVAEPARSMDEDEPENPPETIEANINENNSRSVAELAESMEDDEPEIHPETIVVDDIDYASLTVPELKAELRSKGLRVSGKKAELIERLKAA